MKGVAVAGLAAALALGACGGDSDTATPADTGGGDTPTSGPKAAGGSAIVIKDFEFEPEKLTAKVGDTITVTNQDTAVHTLTAKDKSLDTGNLSEGASGTVTVNKAGTVEYICTIHDYMTGTIEVT